MKLPILLVTFLLSYARHDLPNPDDILGKWINIPKENTIIEVYKNQNNEYNGKIVWAKNNDQKKPIGFIILEKLKYDPESKNWDNGKIHDPNSGKTYSAAAKIKNDGTLEVLGYMGFKFFGTTKSFRKIK
ncbi:MAG TPA: DUF2147 domain-containing protein [Chitinophagaceae bacterium]|jgi:uncharacterized protein (DUF2147 family)|nr:DUF2147 domain-containing protein [Chitinophagaceae bacterium]